MSIKISSFMGPVGFYLRKWMPYLTSNAYLMSQSILRKKESQKYIDLRMKKAETEVIYPLYVAIETINRCNGECAFCPANIHSESRPFAKMTDELFEKILDEISQWQDGKWNGVFSLYVNNEPFIDIRMADMLKKSREKLPYAQMLLFTNGSVLKESDMDIIADSVDVMYINNYATKYKLNPNVKKIYHYVKSDENRFRRVKIVIQKRYSQEILTSRAGNSPNKSESSKAQIKEPCLIPFTDLTIYPNGQVGLCCSDVLETMNFGNCKENTLLEIFNSDKLKGIRKRMAVDRNSVSLCQKCDFIDSGIRLNMMKGNP